MSRLAAILCLTTALVVGIALRCDGLGTRSLWFDEASSYTYATQFGWEEMAARAARNVHPPLSYALLRLWTAAFGDSPIGLRSLSVALAGVTIVGTFLLGRDAYRFNRDPTVERDATARGIGVTAAALVAVASYQIVWSQQARMYSLGTALTAFSSWTLLRAIESRSASGRWWAIYAVLAAALLYTHNYGLFSVFGQGLFFAGYAALSTYRGDRAALRTCLRGAAAFIAAGLLYLPWVPALLGQTGRVIEGYWTRPIEWMTIPATWYELFFPRDDLIEPGRTAILVWAALSVVVLPAFVRRGRAGEWLLLAVAITPFACAAGFSLAIAPIITTRYFLFAQIGVFCAIANMIWRYAGRPSVRTALIALLLADEGYLHSLYRADLNTVERTGMRGLAEHVLRYGAPNEPIIVVHPNLYHTARYYLRGKTDPRLFLGDRIPTHWQAAPFLTQGDFITQAELNGLPDRRIWVVGAASGNTAMPTAWQANPGSTAMFPET
ncbi:MAG: glycosyltransferase family 39 protein, partial [Planctomycetota bacterium]|nr:glycosyltransferase family 39 protein [Planctomycetota bacterium]